MLTIMKNMHDIYVSNLEEDGPENAICEGTCVMVHGCEKPRLIDIDNLVLGLPNHLHLIPSRLHYKKGLTASEQTSQ